MGSDVLVQRAYLPSSVRAIRAGVGLVSRMYHVVVPEVCFVIETLLAHGTAIVVVSRRELVQGETIEGWDERSDPLLGYQSIVKTLFVSPIPSF